MGSKRKRSNGRSPKEPFVRLPNRLIDAPAFISLHPSALQVLLMLARQYSGGNNGALMATKAKFEGRGIHENSGRRGLEMLRDRKIAAINREGYFRRPTLYALTFYEIDDCHWVSGQLLLAPTYVAQHDYLRWCPQSKTGVPQCVQTTTTVGVKQGATSTICTHGGGNEP